jgi:hypothetical protein
VALSWYFLCTDHFFNLDFYGICYVDVDQCHIYVVYHIAVTFLLSLDMIKSLSKDVIPGSDMKWLCD